MKHLKRCFFIIFFSDLKIIKIMQNKNMMDNIWYNSLIKPPLTPPDYIFAPVWIVLYCLIFLSIVIFILKESSDKSLGYLYFFLQILLNFLWAPVFFEMKNIFLALIILFFLLMFLLVTIQQFYLVSKISSLFLLPYLFWVFYALYLNIGFYILNK